MRELETFLGLPWKSGGRDASTGLDCWGLLCYAYEKHLGIKLPPHAFPSCMAPAKHVTDAELRSNLWIEVQSPETWDVVALGKDDGFSHVGIYVALRPPSLLHLAIDKTSAIVPLRHLMRLGFQNIRYYRHADRYHRQ